MTALVEQMRAHVASYKTLSPHRENCLKMCDLLDEIEGLAGKWELDCGLVLQEAANELRAILDKNVGSASNKPTIDS